MSEWKFRAGGFRDAAAIGELWFESWLSTRPANPGVSKAELVERASRELVSRWNVTVVEAGERLIAFLAIVPEEHRLDQLFVAPDVQGCGVGKRLLNLAMQRLPTGFWLKTDAGNARARRFYEQQGLTLTGTECKNGHQRLIYAFEPPEPRFAGA